jgi:hypothetical protein
MPRNALHQNADRTWIMSVDALVVRLRRHLATLVPKREFYYNPQDCGYYTKVVSEHGDNGMTHGPYYFKHLVGLARWTNALHGADRIIPAITLCYARTGKYTPEEPLPKSLQWPVVTMALQDMILQLRGSAGGRDAFVAQLRRDGYTVTGPNVEPDFSYEQALKEAMEDEDEGA